MSVAIVDYGSGNLHSAAKAFERAARESGYDKPITVTRDPDAVVGKPSASCCRASARLPIASAGSKRFRAWSMRWTDSVTKKGKPFFGICVGMQLMAERGHEHQVTPGFGWIEGEVDRIAPADATLKIPHMGWNTLSSATARRCSTASGAGGIAPGMHAYFVHSLSAQAPPIRVDLLADGRLRRTGHRRSVARDNSARHPIPSREEPEAWVWRLIANFLNWKP